MTKPPEVAQRHATKRAAFRRKRRDRRWAEANEHAVQEGRACRWPREADAEVYEPQHLKRWIMPDCYFGEVWPAYYRCQSRDSSALERSNFACMLRELGGESDTVTVVRESHWAVGWVEWIAIHQDDEKALRIADKIAGKLEDYPVIDDDHFSEVEHEDANETWKNCYRVEDRIKYIRDHKDQFEFHDFADLLGCVRGKYFAGYASELLT